MYYFAIIIVFIFVLLAIAPGLLNREVLKKVNQETGKTIPVKLRRNK
jgi:hypothetical protein